MAPIEASGAVVSKDELLSRVWQGRIVDENRLSGEISALHPGARKKTGSHVTLRWRKADSNPQSRSRKSASATEQRREALSCVTGWR
jgi:DNA-binding winged helix-turn-helix (wHTH) protein